MAPLVRCKVEAAAVTTKSSLAPEPGQLEEEQRQGVTIRGPAREAGAVFLI